MTASRTARQTAPSKGEPPGIVLALQHHLPHSRAVMTAARIIIVNFNAGAYLDRCLKAVQAQTRGDFEVVVVDNNSHDGSLAVVPHDDARFRVIPLADNVGFAAANNRGAEGATTPWIVTLNPDAFPAPDWLETLIADAESHPGAAMVGSTLLLDDESDGVTRYDGTGDNVSPFGLPWRGGFRKPARPEHPSGEVFGPCAAAALYDRVMFEAVGGFDECFFCYCEDVDLAFRIRLLGGRCYQSGRSVVRHISSGVTGRHSEFSLFYGYRNAWWMALKCMPAVLLPLVVLGQTLGCLLLEVRGLMLRRRLPGLRALYHGLVDCGPCWTARRSLQRQRRVSTLTILRALTWSLSAFIGRRIVVRPWHPLAPARTSTVTEAATPPQPLPSPLADDR